MVHYPFPLPSNSYIQVKGISEEENYRLIFIESFGGKDVTRKEVIGYYSEIQTESDLLNLLSQQLLLSSKETLFKASSHPLSNPPPLEVQFESLTDLELLSERSSSSQESSSEALSNISLQDPPSPQASPAPQKKQSKIDQVTGWIGGLLFEKTQVQDLLHTSESSVESEDSSGETDDY